MNWRILAAFTLAFGALFATPANAQPLVNGDTIQFTYYWGTHERTYTNATVSVTVINDITNKIGGNGEVIDTYRIILGDQRIEVTEKHGARVYTFAISGTQTLRLEGVDRGFWAGYYGPVMIISVEQSSAKPVSESPTISASVSETISESVTVSDTISETVSESVSATVSEPVTESEPLTHSESATLSPQPEPSPQPAPGPSPEPQPEPTPQPTPEPITQSASPEPTTSPETQSPATESSQSESPLTSSSESPSLPEPVTQSPEPQPIEPTPVETLPPSKEPESPSQQQPSESEPNEEPIDTSSPIVEVPEETQSDSVSGAAQVIGAVGEAIGQVVEVFATAGLDMTPEQREEAQDIVVSTIIVSQVASAASVAVRKVK